MDETRFYSLPKLPYEYTALAPHISEEQLKIHHQKHHQAYVNGANAVFEKLDKARGENTDPDMKAILKELSFHIGGFNSTTCSGKTWHREERGEAGSRKENWPKRSTVNFQNSIGSKRSLPRQR